MPEDLSSPNVITQRPRTAFFKARDVRANIKELGFEKGIELSLTLLADEMAGIRQGFKEMADTQMQFVDLLTQMGTVSGAIVQKINELSRKEEQFEGNVGAGLISPRNS